MISDLAVLGRGSHGRRIQRAMFFQSLEEARLYILRSSSFRACQPGCSPSGNEHGEGKPQDPPPLTVMDCRIARVCALPTLLRPVPALISTQGMLDDFVVVTITCPGPLFVRLRPDPRGLVVVNNFDDVPDDPHTGCPRLGPIERVGTVMPGDALVREPPCKLDALALELSYTQARVQHAV